MKETQSSVYAWACETFGVPTSAMLIAARSHEEAAEAFTIIVANESEGKQKISSEDYSYLKEEFADIIIVLYQVAELTGVQLNSTLCSKVLGRLYGIPRDRTHLGREILKTFGNLFTALQLPESIGKRRALDDSLGLILVYVNKLCNDYGIPLGQAIDDKMEINRSRSWKTTGIGIGHHT